MKAAVRLHLTGGAEPYPGYRLETFLGKGGWGEVWKTRRVADGAYFALKFLPAVDSHVGSAQEIRALQAIRQLNHPNILHTEQIWSCPGYLVIVMELAEGNLMDVLDLYYQEYKHPIVPDHLCYFLSQAAAALDFLNVRQHKVDGQRVAFRHCDVKPSNLLFLGQAVKVADFSLSVQTTAPMWYHRRGGTVNYAAPEIFKGWLSDRSDQYALAVSYVQLRTGHFPFHDTPTTFRNDYNRPEPDLARLTEAERPIIARALNHTPQSRWTSCVEMMQKLTQAVALLTPQLQPV